MTHTRPFQTILFTILVAAGSAAVLAGCSSGTGEISRDQGLITLRTQEIIRQVVPSVVGVGAGFDFDVQTFHYADSAQFLRDPASPTGYKLLPGDLGITRSHRFDEAQGAGIILYREKDRTVILTSRHILDVPDTVDTFFRDAAGKPTDVLFFRTIRTHTGYHVVDQGGLLKAAEVLTTDPRTDLGLLIVTTSSLVGAPFPFRIAYGSSVDWGDLALVFGSPHGIKQLTVGFVSRSPYPGSFMLDVTARSGFSGGPVMRVSGAGELELVGIVRAVPATKLQYLAPPPEMVPGQALSEETLGNSTMAERDLIEYGAVYAVNAERIGSFLRASLPRLSEQGIVLPQQLLPED